MSNYVTSLIRTWVPVFVGTFLAWLAASGLDLDIEPEYFVPIVISAWYALARWIEDKFPQLQFLGLSLNGPSTTPGYKAPEGE